MSTLLFNAFRALGPGPTRREVALVAAALREGGDEEVGRLLDWEAHPQDWDRCCAIADEAGAFSFVALDLALAFCKSGGVRRAYERRGETASRERKLSERDHGRRDARRKPVLDRLRAATRRGSPR